jgi:hypothetical protein
MIHTVINEKKQEESIGFPKLMIGVQTENVYLMDSETSGFRVRIGHKDDPGKLEYREFLNAALLKDFEGSITISNKRLQ